VLTSSLLVASVVWGPDAQASLVGLLLTDTFFGRSTARTALLVANGYLDLAETQLQTQLGQLNEAKAAEAQVAHSCLCSLMPAPARVCAACVPAILSAVCRGMGYAQARKECDEATQLLRREREEFALAMTHQVGGLAEGRAESHCTAVGAV
jgi:hypothetical protein